MELTATRFFRKRKRGKRPPSLEVLLSLSERFHRSLDWDLAWRREVVKTSVRGPLRVAVTGREKGLLEIGISRIPLFLMERGKVEIGAEILLRISREFGKSIEWLLTGQCSPNL